MLLFELQEFNRSYFLVQQHNNRSWPFANDHCIYYICRSGKASRNDFSHLMGYSIRIGILLHIEYIDEDNRISFSAMHYQLPRSLEMAAILQIC